jgi:Flp pilus assembly pilin Flp
MLSLNRVFIQLAAHMQREEGQTLVEYALIVTFIAIACVAAMTLLGGNISTKLQSIAGSL